MYVVDHGSTSKPDLHGPPKSAHCTFDTSGTRQSVTQSGAVELDPTVEINIVSDPLFCIHPYVDKSSCRDSLDLSPAAVPGVQLFGVEP